MIIRAANNRNVEVTVNSYDASSGIFSITAESGDVEQINKFIADLMMMDAFEKVDYTGYNAITTIDGAGYQINVVCTLAARTTETVIEEEEG